MGKRKERSLEQLYKCHRKLAKPRVTPILEGIFHMQGPVGESDSETETDLENNEGAKTLVGGSTEKMDTDMERNSGLECKNHIKNSIVEDGDNNFCMQSNSRTGKELLDESNTTKQITIDSIEREETQISLKKRTHDNVQKARAVITKTGDVAGSSSECDHRPENGDSVHMIEECEKVVKDVYASQEYCKAKLILCGEETEDNHQKCSPSEDLQRISQGDSMPSESVQSFNLGSKDKSQLAGLIAQECCDNLESQVQHDFVLEVTSIKDYNGNEIDNLRDNGATNTLNNEDPNILAKVLASTEDHRDQSENKSMELSRESICKLPDLAPGSDLGTQLPSAVCKGTISEIYTKSVLCNAECDKRNMALDEHSTPEEVHDVTDRCTKLAENVADQGFACLGGITSSVIKKVNSSGTENFSDESDEVKPLSMQETMVLQDHNRLTQIPASSNLEITDACTNPNLTEIKTAICSPLEVHAISLPLQKESQNRYIIKENLSQEMVSSPFLGTPDLFNVISVTTTKESEPFHLNVQHGEGSVLPCTTDQMVFHSSKQPLVSTTQEIIASVTKPFSGAHTVKHSIDGSVGTNMVCGLQTMENSQPLTEHSEAINTLPVDVIPDFQAAPEQMPQMRINERLFTEDAGNQMVLDEHSNIDKMDAEPSKLEGASVASAPVFDDNLHEADLVEDDVKVCDICGDAGREDLLAICSMCNDGAEHIYCMQIMLDKVPESNWLCEGCKLTQNATLKKAVRTNPMSKPASLSSKKESTSDSSQSRPSAITDKKRFDPEITRIKGTVSSQSSTKRRAEELDFGPAAKKQAVEARSVQQCISSSNAKYVLSRDKSFKSADVGRTKPSVSVALTGNHLSSGLNYSGKSSAAIGAQSPRLQAGMLSSKSRFTSVNSLTSESKLFPVASSTAASCALSALTDRDALSSKSADGRPSSSLASRLSNTAKLITIPKNKKDFGDVGGQASIIRERSSIGGFSKVVNDSISFKSKGSINVSTSIQPRMSPHVQNASGLQMKETRIAKPRKAGSDSMTRRPVLKSGNAVNDLKPTVNNTSVSQATCRMVSSRKDICKSKPAVPEEQSIVGPSPVATNAIKEELSSATCSGMSLPTMTTIPIVFKTGIADIKSEPLDSSGLLCYSESQTSTEQCNSESTSGLKSIQMAGTLGFPIDSKGSSSPNDRTVDISYQSPHNSKNDDKPKNFTSSWTRNFLSDGGSTRCYKCKELGHTAQFCSNRSFASTGNSSLRVSTLKLSAAKISREMSWSSSGKWNNPLETLVTNYTIANENAQISSSDSRLLSSNAQEQEEQPDSNFPLQLSVNNVALLSKESAVVCGKLDGESSMSGDLSLLNSELGRDLCTGTLDLAPGLSIDLVVNHSSTAVTLSEEVPSSSTFEKKITKWCNNAQIYSSQKLYVEGDGTFISPGDYCKLAASATIPQYTVHPTESTVTAVKRNISCDLPVISNGNYPGTFMRELLCQQSAPSEIVKISALPEHNFLWQGGFEVRSKGNSTNYYDGLQAHASTCAVLKVLDAAKKLSSRILLEEVPRLSSWPMQFQYSCPSDENVALYFFAKDLESYEKSYKKLLECMLKNDFALRANFDGVELLIFPSNQLPEKSQRWNRLLYLWAVFRQRKANCMDSLAYPPERTHGQLLTNISTAGNSSSKIVARVLPSPPVVGFSEREDMDIDMEGGQEGSLAERGVTGLGRETSQTSPVSPLFSPQDERKTNVTNVQNAPDFVEQKLPITQMNDEFPGEDKLSFKKHFSILSSETGLHKKTYLNKKEKQIPLDTDDGRAVESQPFRQSVISQISSWRERANSACLGRIPSGLSAVSSSSLERKNNSSDSSKIGRRTVESQPLGQSVISQISSWRERANSACLGRSASAPCVVSSNSLERQDNSSDSSKIAQVSSHSQTNTEKERSKSKDDEIDRGRERAKEFEYASFRSKDLGHKEWKLRERERNEEVTTEKERDRRSRRHEEYSSHESRPRRDSREERRHHFSRSPTRHGSRSYFPSIRTNYYDHHHSRMRSPDFDQERHVQPSSGAEVSGGSHRRDTVSPKGRSYNDFLVDDKGQRKLKKSYSEIYVREICKEQDSSCRNSSSRSSPELNICNQTQQVSDLPTSIQFSRSSTLEHVHHDNQEYNLSFLKESKVTERFLFPESIDAERDDKTTKASEQWSIKPSSMQKSPKLTSYDHCIPSVDVRESLDLDVPNLELALGAKRSSKSGVRPMFVQSHDKIYTQQQPASPTTSEDGSSLSLSLTFSMPQKEQVIKSVLKESGTLPDNGNVDTSLLLFGGSVDSYKK